MIIPRGKPQYQAALAAILIFIILGVIGVTCLATTKKLSVTPDEIVHISAGLSYLQKRDGRMNPEHPPLLKVLAALPLALHGIKPAYADPAWNSAGEDAFGAASFNKWGPGPLRVANPARLPMIFLTLILALTIFFMARALAGTLGGMLSLVLFASTPFFFAYGTLVHTDIGVALFSLLTVWTFATLWRDANWKSVTFFAASLSAAFLSKFSAVALLPTIFVLGIWFGYERRDDLASLRRAIKFSSLGLVISSLIVYFSYFFLFWKTDTAWLLLYKFHHSPSPIHEFYVTGEFLRIHPLMARILFPVILYLLGIGSVLQRVVLGKITDIGYILGRTYPGGTVKFFPVLMFYKMTPGFLFLMVMLICLAIWRVRRKSASQSIIDPKWRFHLRALCTLAAIFGGASLTSHLDIGIRHISIEITVLVLLASLLVPLVTIAGPRARIVMVTVVGVGLIGGIYSTAASFPNYISYFNCFRGHKPKYEIAIDSNLDWGQSIVQLRDFMSANHVSEISVESVGPFPDLYIPQASQFKCVTGKPPDTSWIAVGANVLARANGQCDYLLSYPHWPIAGGAAYVFHIPAPRSAGRVRAGIPLA